MSLFTENGFKTVFAIWGFVGTILWGIGFAKGWWFTGNYVKRQDATIDAQNVIMEASAKLRADEQAERLKAIEDLTEKEFESIRRRDEVMIDGIREIKARGGGGGNV